MKLPIAALLVSLSITALVLLVLDSEADRGELAARIDRFCDARKDELRFLTHNRVVTREMAAELRASGLDITTTEHGLRNRLALLLDPHASKLCLSVEVPYEPTLRRDADLCWAKSGDDACYIGLATAMLGFYDQRRR